MVIRWSDEDGAFLVSLPGWEGQVLGAVTHGDTDEEAAAHGRDAIEALVASARKHGEPSPEPRLFTPAEEAGAPSS